MKKTRSKYRRVWEREVGPIPIDSNGRTYDIHHIDGNSTNDNLNNLKCVSLQEHYEIHLSQGDYQACQAILIRLAVSANEQTEIARLSGLQRRGISRPDMIGDLNPMRNPNYAKNLSLVTKGFPKSDKGRDAIGNAQRYRISQKILCMHCGRLINPLSYNQWHGNKCVKNPNLISEIKDIILKKKNNNFSKNNPSNIKKICEYCNISAGAGNYKRWHGDNCKRKIK